MLTRNTILLASALVGVHLCGLRAALAGTPIHRALICRNAIDCPRERVERIRSEWVKAVNKDQLDGSTFAIWRLTSLTAEASPQPILCRAGKVGGGSPTAAWRRWFDQESAPLGRLPEPGHDPSPCTSFDGSTPVTVMVPSLAAGGDQTPTFVIDPQDKSVPLDVFLLCDGSTSAEQGLCAPRMVDQALVYFIRRSHLRPGSTFAQYVVSVGGKPARVTRREVRAWSPAAAITALLIETPEPRKAPYGSAIAESIAFVGGDFEAAHRRELWLPTDLAQVTPGRWNFEKTTTVNVEAFVTDLERQQLHPPRAGTRLVFCGPPFAPRLLDVWPRILNRWGAAPFEYHPDCVSQLELESTPQLADVASTMGERR